MAQNYKYNKSIVEKFAIKGELSSDGKYITYIDADKDQRTITVDKCFSKFHGYPIELAIALKTEEDLSGDFEEE